MWTSATLAALALSFGCLANENAQTPVDEFDLGKLVVLCTAVSTGQKDSSNQEEYSFVYEKKIYDAARVDFSKDTGETARSKIQALFRIYPQYLRCDANDFNVRSGSILKYAVATGQFNLIDDAISVWKLDPNVVDPSDGKTLLDYIDDLMAQYSGTTVGTKLQIYRAVVVRGGGLSSNQLPSR